MKSFSSMNRLSKLGKWHQCNGQSFQRSIMRKKTPDSKVEGKIKRKLFYRIREKLRLLNLYFSIQIIIDKYATAIFANHYFFVLFYFALFLGRDGIKATTACIALNWHNSKTITIAFADFVIAG